MVGKVNILWLKRDLRLHDHLPLKRALETQLPLIILYIYEPSLIAAPFSDERHWRFVLESIEDMNNTLAKYQHKVDVLYGEAAEVFAGLTEQYEINAVFSYQETGTLLTYQRDLTVAKLFKKSGLPWKEFRNNAVIRGLKNRDTWSEKRNEFMKKPLETPNLQLLIPAALNPEIKRSFSPDDFISSINREHLMQKGGESHAKLTLESFLTGRHNHYMSNISKPMESRESCSRLSPYLAWGNLSVRQVEQAKEEVMKNLRYRKNLSAFQSRVAWRSHFIQKLESEPEIEVRNVNPAYDQIRQQWDERKYEAWKTGQTGYPLVDACMRCVTKTGYINFRMRAMLVSFLTHHLWLDWKEGANHLARQFLDFEPGIHFPQFQMQASTTGINTIRIYNPVKQALEHDPEAKFIKIWIAELSQLPVNLALQPWLITPIEESMYNFNYGKDYPTRIVDTEATYRHANKLLWQVKKSSEAKQASAKILKTHVKKD